MSASQHAPSAVHLDGDYATVVFTRVLKHSPERVWTAITDPADLKQWLYAEMARIEPRQGGTVEMTSGPSQFHSKGAILTWDPPHVFEYEWKVEPAAVMPMGQDAVFRYQLAPHPAGTLLTVEYRRLTRAVAGGFAPGSQVLMERLEAWLDGKPMPAWAERMAELQPLYADSAKAA